MNNNRQPVRGFRDCFGQPQQIREQLLALLNFRARQFGFTALSVPTIEQKSVYDKPTGSTNAIRSTDFFRLISAKENQEFVLRPEFTSGVVRAVLRELGPHDRGTKTFYTSGSCFRYERPQKFRTREFLQWNLESLWTNTDQVDFLLLFLSNLLQEIFPQSTEQLALNFNYLSADRAKQIGEILTKAQISKQLCSFCQERFEQKAFYQILDCADCSAALAEVKKTVNQLADNQKTAELRIFDLFSGSARVVRYQKTLGRGLSYYSGPVFEFGFASPTSNHRWISLLGGGSYQLSSFAKEFTNPIGSGFAFGIDRICEIQNLEHLKAVSLQLRPEQVLFRFFTPLRETLNKLAPNSAQLKLFLAIQSYFVRHNYAVQFKVVNAQKVNSAALARSDFDYVLTFDDAFWSKPAGKINVYQSAQKEAVSLTFDQLKAQLKTK